MNLQFPWLSFILITFADIEAAPLSGRRSAHLNQRRHAQVGKIGSEQNSHSEKQHRTLQQESKYQ
jgi:hypothetical protein